MVGTWAISFVVFGLGDRSRVNTTTLFGRVLCLGVVKFRRAKWSTCTFVQLREAPFEAQLLRLAQ